VAAAGEEPGAEGEIGDRAAGDRFLLGDQLLLDVL
jgi:hypothetical protein